MNEAIFNGIAFDIAKKADEAQLQKLILATTERNTDKLLSLAKETNAIVSLNEYVQLLELKYLANRVSQNKFIAQYLNMKGICCTAAEVNRYNENIRVALMREASFVCDEEIANDSVS